MQPILLYGHPLGSSMGLVAAFEWLGQPYKLSRVDMLGEMRDPAYARLNARHETPVLLTEDGGVVAETMAILRWIEQRDSERRVSFDPDSSKAVRLQQFAAFLNTGFTASFTPYWMALELEEPEPAYQDAMRRLGRTLVNDRHRKLEGMIGDSPYLLGDRPTLADAVFIGVARWADFHQAIDPADYPKVRALKARLEADPAVLFATAIENGEQPKGTGAMKGQVPLEELLELEPA
ncbi:MAG: glutathione S-transferase family protein [Pseudomonadota bacterium]|nr:glutathione S-transferase family protein [Pseudomonadota bacterium]